MPAPRRERIASLEPEPPVGLKRTVTATNANHDLWTLPLENGTGFASLPRSVTDLVRARVTESFDTRWCRVRVGIEVAVDNLPGLYIAAASGLSSSAQGQPTAGCAGTLPTLQELAKLLIAAPQIPE